MPTRRDPVVNDVVETKVGSVTLIVRILDIEFGNYTRTETVEVLQAPEGHDFPEVITIKRLDVLLSEGVHSKRNVESKLPRH
ncbi:unnamed protein product [Clonostachys chloroleuca]|uniref:Uncharacterized protein n=1 Tax=Clonostachys chloroleuca TaxID=1926264 RepID=A0AA35Q7W4_9HYPO|nr:unnamed protein product [Clonostachys chloroleuca]